VLTPQHTRNEQNGNTDEEHSHSSFNPRKL
jgi:hypothetical protein